ncbi:MAG: hypothetical protein RLZZ532_1116 [Cyanobacteriota bacterium]|jgi:hypothetical protein
MPPNCISGLFESTPKQICPDKRARLVLGNKLVYTFFPRLAVPRPFYLSESELIGLFFVASSKDSPFQESPRHESKTPGSSS